MFRHLPRWLILITCLILPGCSARHAANEAPSEPAEHEKSAQEENRLQREKVEEKIAVLKTDISHKRDRLIELQRRTNSPRIINPIYRYPSPEDFEHRTIIEQMQDIRLELARVGELLAILRDPIGNLSDPEIVLRFTHDVQIADLAKQINQMELLRDYAMGSSRVGDKDPAVKDYQEKLATLKIRLNDRLKTLQLEILKSLMPEDQSQLESRQTDLHQKLDALQRRVDELGPMLGVGTPSSQLEGLQAEIREEERSREFLQSQLDRFTAAQQP